MRIGTWGIAVTLAATLGAAAERVWAGDGSADAAAAPALVQRIGFGSCCRQDKPAPIFDVIAASKPDLFIFLGDNIYGDSDDPAVLKAKYEKLGAIPGFQKLRAACPLLATWDDHDYGRNDGGAEYPAKQESQQAMLDFFGEPSDSPRRGREGVYDARVFGPEGRRVQIILLDTRYHRSALRTQDPQPARESGRWGRYQPTDDPDQTVLGEAQWTWLEEQLRQPAEVRIIASSIQFVSEEHGFEKWANFPRERARLIRLLYSTAATGVIFVSGDRHSAEISRLVRTTTGRPGANEPPYPLYDVTASSFNQKREWMNELNRWRVGLAYFEPNYGEIEIDWSGDDPKIAMVIRDEAGKPVLREDTRRSALGGPGQ